MEEGV